MQIPQIFKTLGLRGMVAALALLVVAAWGMAAIPSTPVNADLLTGLWVGLWTGFTHCLHFFGPGVVFTLALFEIMVCGRCARKKSNTQEPQQ